MGSTVRGALRADKFLTTQYVAKAVGLPVIDAYRELAQLERDGCAIRQVTPASSPSVASVGWRAALVSEPAP